jgi:hypothetical protein
VTPAEPSNDLEDSEGRLERLLAQIEAWPKSEGVRVIDIVGLDEPLRTTLNHVVREGSVSLRDFALQVGLTVDQANLVVEELLEHGFLRVAENAGDTYRIWYAPAHKRATGLWNKLLDEDDEGS